MGDNARISMVGVRYPDSNFQGYFKVPVVPWVPNLFIYQYNFINKRYLANGVSDTRVPSKFYLKNIQYIYVLKSYIYIVFDFRQIIKNNSADFSLVEKSTFLSHKSGDIKKHKKIGVVAHILCVSTPSL